MADHCFISYSTADALEFARQLADELEGGEDKIIKTWFDKRDIDPARDWDEQIAEGIRSCKCMLFVMTADSVMPNSMCKNEWNWALRYKKPVVPIRLHTGVEQPFGLGNRQWIDFTSEFRSGLAKLRRFIRRMDEPEGILDTFNDRFADAERDLHRARPEDVARIKQEMDDLKEQIKRQEEIVRNPKAAEEKTEKNIQSGLERERQPENPVAGKATRKFINPPPGISPPYFQDRHFETEQIASFLKDASQRLMTIIGRAGIGKTATICRLLKDLERGVLPDDLGEMQVEGIIYLSETGSHKIKFANIFYDLCKLLTADADQTLDSIYKNPQGSTESKMQALLDHFQDKPVILLLDNIEPLVSEEQEELPLRDAELNEAMRAFLNGPHTAVKAIITTRVPPKALNSIQPGRQRIYPLEAGLEPKYAVEMLRQMDKDGILGLKNSKEDVLQRAHERTRGFPKALEALFQILSSDRYTTLEELLAMPTPHDVVEALVGEAFNRLDPSAQKVMQALAVYNRPVSPAAIDYLLQPHLPSIDSALVLNRLVNMHFARREAGRYYLHPADKEHAFSLIENREQRVENSESPEPPTTNLQSLVSNDLSFTQHDLLNRAADYFAQARKPREEWKKLEDLAAQLAEFELRCSAGDYDIAASVLHEVDFDYLLLWGHYRLMINLREILSGKITDKWEKGYNFTSLGRALNYIGEVRKAIIFLEQALELDREVKDKQGESVDLSTIANAYADLGDVRKAIELYEKALVIDREISDRKGEGADLGNLGSCYADLGNAHKAIEFYEQSLVIAREIGNRRSEGNNLSNLGNRYFDLGDASKAIKFYEQNLVIILEIGDKYGETNCLCNKGFALLFLDQYLKAKEFFLQAIQIADEISLPAVQQGARNGLSQTYLFQNDLVNARATIEAAFQYDVPLYNHNATALHVSSLCGRGKGKPHRRLL